MNIVTCTALVNLLESAALLIIADSDFNASNDFLEFILHRK